MKAVVLAAGKGIRLRPLTNDKPKALVELNGKPLVEHVLGKLQKAGIDEVGLVVGWHSEMIEERLGESFGRMPLRYLKQEQALGTANAIATAKDFIGKEGFLCTYSDVIAESGIYQGLVEEFKEKEGNVFEEGVEDLDGEFDAVIVGREVKDPWRFGVLKLEDGKVLDIVEKPAVGEEPSNWISAGIYWFSPKIFELIAQVGKSERGEYEITDSLKKLALESRLGFKKYEGKCIDISNVEELKEAEKVELE